MITIDYQSKLPFYEQIAQRFQTLILRGILPPDTQMPSVRSLAMELSINPNTIQKAFSLLEQQGYIYSVKGRGNYVADVTALAEQKRQSLLKEAEHRRAGTPSQGTHAQASSRNRPPESPAKSPAFAAP